MSNSIKSISVTEGDVIHYVVDVGEQRGRHRGGQVVNVIDHDVMIADLRVNMDTTGDKTTDVLNVKAAQYENTVRPLGTWHFHRDCNT
jgi:hypothetical protein